MKILNFGSVNIDRVFRVEEIARPGQTVSSQGMQLFPGGKGFNQSIALARAGARVSHAGMIGKDGLWLRDMLLEAGADCESLLVTAGDTGSAFIQIDASGQNCIVLDAGANYKNSPDFTDEVLSRFEKGDMLLIQNEINGLSYLMERAKAKGMTVILNPSPLNEALLVCPLDTVDWFIMNEDEGMRLSGCEKPGDILAAMGQRFPKASVVLTLGGDGSVAMHEGRLVKQGIYPAQVVDTTGAGDTFTGYFLALMAEGQSIEACLDAAARAASLAISRMGAGSSIPMRSEII